ncbi:MAG: hypothetical protein KIS66_07440 [Fimbriimonadaceae bacterium]|nr:hypothetical protein [Fimbriimonadaceae bacterium]
MSSSALSSLRDLGATDPASAARSAHVAVLAVAMAEALGDSEAELEALADAAGAGGEATHPLIAFARSVVDHGAPPEDASDEHRLAYERVRGLIQPIER